MEIGKEFVRQRVLNGRKIQSAAEYVLPDYYGDVRKILYTSYTPSVSGKYKNGDTLDVTGVVNYSIVYLDGEGKMSEVNFSSDFDHSEKLGEGYVDSIVGVEPKGVWIRLQGPRKISAKSELELWARENERAVYMPDGDAVGLPDLISDTAAVSVARAMMPETRECEMRDELGMYEGLILDEISILGKRAYVRDVSIKCEGTRAEISADVEVCLLIRIKDEMPFTVCKKYSLIETLDSDRELTGDATPFVRVKNISTELLPSAEGISVNATILTEVGAVLEDNGELDLVLDCFSKSYATLNEMGEFNYREYLGRVERRGEMTFSVDPKEYFTGNLRNIIYVGATLGVDGVEKCEKGIKITGKIQFSGIACQINDENMPEYEPMKINLNFEENVNSDLHIPDNSVFLPHISVESVSCEVGEEKVKLVLCYDASVSAFVDKMLPVVTSSTLTGEEYHRDASTVSVYYPTREDTLFSVAKAFHTSPSEIASVNVMDEAVFRSADKVGGLSSLPFLIIK